MGLNQDMVREKVQKDMAMHDYISRFDWQTLREVNEEVRICGKEVIIENK